MYNIETLSVNRVVNKGHFYERIINFGKLQNSCIMQKIILKIRYFDRGLSKSFIKLTLFFHSNPHSLLMDKIMKNKKSLEPVTSHSSTYKASSEKFLY